MQYTIIYMAAGNSRRFGKKNKLLQEFRGKPLYSYGLELLQAAARERENVRAVVITQYQEIVEAVEKCRSRKISCFLNPDSRKGVSYTIRRGIREALENGPVDYFLFMTADQPFLRKKTLEQFFAEGEKGNPVVSAAWREQPGNPVMFRADLAEELVRLKEDEGGRKVWKKYASQGVLIQAEDPKELQDLDVPKDWTAEE